MSSAWNNLHFITQKKAWRSPKITPLLIVIRREWLWIRDSCSLEMLQGMGQNPGTIREPQVIAGLKWMFIPLKYGIYRYWPIPIFPRYFPMVFPRVLTHTHYAISFPRSGREQPSSRVNMVS